MDEHEHKHKHKHAGESLIDRLRGTGVGIEDPNIVGDVGPTDIPPGHDPGNVGLFADPLEVGELELDDFEPVDSVEPPDLLAQDETEAVE